MHVPEESFILHDSGALGIVGQVRPQLEPIGVVFADFINVMCITMQTISCYYKYVM